MRGEGWGFLRFLCRFFLPFPLYYILKIKAGPAEFRMMMKNDGFPWFYLLGFGGKVRWYGFVPTRNMTMFFGIVDMPLWWGCKYGNYKHKNL
jgi:hypothetical protein